MQIKLGYFQFQNNFKYQKCILIEIQNMNEQYIQFQKKGLKIYKNRMLCSLSHELKTPLNLSITLLEYLQQNKLANDEVQEQIISPSLNSNKLLLNVVNDCLDYAQICLGKFQIKFQQFSILQLIQECVELVKFQAFQKGINIKTFFDDCLPKDINSDPSRLKQIILNLLTNSIRFTEKGNIKISTKSLPENLIRIEVQDTGCGITKNQITKILNSFGNINNQNALNTQNAGFGLSISNILAKGLGQGRKIEIKSELNVGSSFIFYIIDYPKFKNEPNSSLAKQKMSNYILYKQNNINYNNKYYSKNLCKNCSCILIVDDVQFNCYVLKLKLDQYGFKCEIANSGMGGIQKVQEKFKSQCCKKFHLIFMDIDMPGKNGLQTTQDIIQFYKSMQTTACVISAYSAFVGQIDKQNAFDSGMQYYITKPLQQKDLETILNQVFL
ncbi:hypothetical protein IMG5_164250 [Ichthyophthirius multifiliis]|uniref:Histidine kinase n=1 Tax=Ichthyophthirius multifiliis TaxID=5932 RepID=G0R0F3_ICHMU|nr:hypothetical protein IMG5_164250 [Ichthyophthirius multifiliis]EGR29050.1 hypothetical protein IMG5_164250 [Ichthyophthirius multifiliis]|eukprot:XP_004030286.1 hypothetical protein IMG5_164250 [Ichthyophthirius multifiliis]